MVMACSGCQFGLCRWFTYRTVFLPTLESKTHRRLRHHSMSHLHHHMTNTLG